MKRLAGRNESHFIRVHSRLFAANLSSPWPDVVPGPNLPSEINGIRDKLPNIPKWWVYTTETRIANRRLAVKQPNEPKPITRRTVLAAAPMLAMAAIAAAPQHTDRRQSATGGWL